MFEYKQASNNGNIHFFPLSYYIKIKIKTCFNYTALHKWNISYLVLDIITAFFFSWRYNPHQGLYFTAL